MRGRITGANDSDRLSVRLKGHDYPSAFRSVQLDASGGYHIDGLEPGAWTLSVYPGHFVEGATIEVTIEPSDSVVVHDLDLVPR